MGIFKKVKKVFSSKIFSTVLTAASFIPGPQQIFIKAAALASSVLSQRAQQKKAAAAAKKSEEAALRQSELLAAQSGGVLLNVEANDAPLPVVYGRRRVGGVTCLKETTGINNSALYKVVALSEGPVQAVQNVYYDNVLATDSRFTIAPTNVIYLGTDSQAADGNLLAALPGKWTSSHQGKGVAYLLAAIAWDASVFHGEPTITCDLWGRTLYDPRDGATRFSNNPALVIRDYLAHAIYGRGIPTSAIDDDAFGDAADYCDERVSVPTHSESVDVSASGDHVTFSEPTFYGLGDGVQFTGAAPGGFSVGVTYYYIPVTETTGKLASSYANALAATAMDLTSGDGTKFTLAHIDQARYQLDGVVDVAQTPLDNVTFMLSACDGFLVYTAGVYKLKIDKAESASGFAFTEDNIVGDWKISLASRRDRYNRAKAVFMNPAKTWQPDYAIYDSTAYRTADNGLLLELEFSLPYTANVYRAQRQAQLQVRQSRLGIQCSFRATVEALRCEIGDVVEVTHSTPDWTAKKFRIEALELQADDEVVVTASEYDDGAYSLDDLSAVRTAPATNLPTAFTVGVPGAPDVTEALYETTGSAGVKARATVSWGASADAFVETYQLEWKASGDSTYNKEPITRGTTLILDDMTPGSYHFRVRAFNTLGVGSAYSGVTFKELAGLTAPPEDISGFTITKVGGVALAVWTLAPDLDVQINGNVVIRHANQTTGASWNNGVVLKEFQGGQVSGFLDLVTGTYMAKARDSSGNYSATEASFVVTEGMVSGFTTVTTVTEHTAFTGTKTNVANTGSAIQLDGTTLIDDEVTDIDDWPYIDGLGGISATGSYAFASTLDLTTVETRRFESDIEALSFDTGDLIDDRTENIDDWDEIDGAVINDCTVTLQARTTDDDPAGAPVWSEWVPYRVADFTCRAIQHKLDFASGDEQHNISVSVLKVDVKTPVSP